MAASQHRFSGCCLSSRIMVSDWTVKASLASRERVYFPVLTACLVARTHAVGEIFLG